MLVLVPRVRPLFRWCHEHDRASSANPGRLDVVADAQAAVSAANEYCADMTEALIRQADGADLAAITQLRREWTREQDPDDTDPGFGERFAGWFARESARRIVWLAQADGRAVGMMNLAIFERMPRPGRAPSRWGYLGNAFVLAAYRNQGIGTQLLSAVVSYADENDFARVVLSPSDQAIPFYQRAGFGPASDLLLRTPPR